MTYFVEPHIGARPILLGMDKMAVHQVLGDALNTFRRGGDLADGDTEMYAECFINYDASDRCAEIEFFGTACVMFQEVNLMETPCSQLRRILGVEDVLFPAWDAGFSSEEYGIRVYAPDEEDDPDCLPESICIALSA